MVFPQIGMHVMNLGSFWKEVLEEPGGLRIIQHNHLGGHNKVNLTD